jgi:hypothetical protein
MRSGKYLNCDLLNRDTIYSCRLIPTFQTVIACLHLQAHKHSVSYITFVSWCADQEPSNLPS